MHEFKEHFKNKDEEYNLPNVFLDYDDLLQELYIKAYDLLKKYFSNNKNFNIDRYLITSLEEYGNTFIYDSLYETFNKYEREIIININSEFYNYTYHKHNEEMKKKILDNAVSNKQLESSILFIKAILDGCSYTELEENFYLDEFEVNAEIEKISCFFKRNIKQIDIIDEQDFIKKKASCYIFKIPFYMNLITNYIDDVYNILNPYYSVNYKNIESAFINNIILNCDNINLLKINNEQLNCYLLNLLENIKQEYVFKVLNLSNNNNFFKQIEINQSFIENVVLNKILDSRIYEIPKYKNFIIECVDFTYNEAKEQFSIDYEDIYNYFYNEVLKFIFKFIASKEYNLKNFNIKFMETMKLKKDYYSYNKFVVDNELIKTKKLV